MVSTHRRNMDLMVQCAEQVGTSLERIKASPMSAHSTTVGWHCQGVCVCARACVYETTNTPQYSLLCGENVHVCVCVC